jgi:hypothetical protein
MDFVSFINDGFSSQQRYSEAAGLKGPLDDLTPEERYARVIEHFGHWQEEIIEARVLCKRRSWKNSEPGFLDNEKIRREFVAELFDTTLFLRAVCAFAGISGEEFVQVAEEKLNYNSKRKDHSVNGNEPAPQDPTAELKGDCASSVFYQAV